MNKINYLDVIISPNVTEKSTSLSEFNKVVFKVRKDVSKKLIKKSIEKLFKVNVVRVNTLNIKGKNKLVNKDTGEVYRYYHRRPRLDWSERWIRGKKTETFGKLTVTRNPLIK